MLLNDWQLNTEQHPYDCLTKYSCPISTIMNFWTYETQLKKSTFGKYKIFWYIDSF